MIGERDRKCEKGERGRESGSRSISRNPIHYHPTYHFHLRSDPAYGGRTLLAFAFISEARATIYELSFRGGPRSVPHLG